ncbi:MAG: hypothetical protein PHU72_06690 [Dethiosulfovibrio sp.]|nr:hypothetical protein [Dethiosulfovibrio sp.]
MFFDNIFITLTYKCNCFCSKCFTRKHVNKNKEITKEMLSYLTNWINDHNFFKKISIGTGEPLTCNYLSNFIDDITKKPDLKLRILTNGKLFSPNLPDYFFNKEIKWGVTLDGFDQKDLEGLQKNLNIDNVKNNIALVAKKWGPDVLYLNYTLNKRNLGNLFNYVNFANENNIKDVYVTKIKFFKGINDHLKESLDVDYNCGNARDSISSIQDFCSLNNLKIKGLEETRPPSSKTCFDYANTISPIIDIDGSISFCQGREDVVIGNIKESDCIDKMMKIYSELNKNRIAQQQWCSLCLMKSRDEENIYHLPVSLYEI